MKELTSSAHQLSRRTFIARSALATSAAMWAKPLLSDAAQQPTPPIAAFSKIYQTLNLNFEAAAQLTADAGLAGIDCPVRPGGEIAPERVSEDLPRYAEALKKRDLKVQLITSGITSTATPQAEQVLREAKKLGIRFYRLGFMTHQADAAAAKQVAEIKSQLKDVAALNKEIGITGLLQNHSPSGRTYIGGDLAEMRELVKTFDPSQIGLAFDIGHALVVHGQDWRTHFNELKSHLKVAYVKDVKLGGGWVPFGEGELARSGYFKLLKELNYNAPLSLHIEFNWDDNGKNRTPAALVQALKQSASVLRQWLTAN